jgi:hypothetical protein
VLEYWGVSLLREQGGWGVLWMVGLLEGCQRSHWEIWCDCHLSGGLMCIPHECNIILMVF